MEKIYLRLDQGVPQFACTTCSNCHSIYGRSLCSINNRGCCWYFPKLTLHEIHKMTKSWEGLNILDSIRKLPSLRIYNYYIHAKGNFDEAGYKKFLVSGQAYQYDVEDKSIFFRTCPFVKPGKGCILPIKYRSYVCNFYICHEAAEQAEKSDLYKSYIKERDSYIRWIEWQNYSLEMLLREKGLTLEKNFDEVIRNFKDIPLENYEFLQLSPIETISDFYIGA